MRHSSLPPITRVAGIGLLFLAGALALVTGFSCQLPNGAGTGTPALIIQISSPQSKMMKTLVPNVDMVAATYQINGTGPSGATFSTTVAAGTTATVSTLTSGTWTVNVSGVDAEGVFITFGSRTAQVTTGQTATVAITVTPIVGPGSLSLTLTWPAASVANPIIQAQLIPATGSATALTFSTPSNGSATYSGSGIMNGYYTLTLELFDSSTLVMGAVDVVEIIQGQTTSGTYNFNSVNDYGSIQATITPTASNPLTVTISGAVATVAPGAPVTLSASVPAGTGNVVYTWYVNGVSQGVGSSLTINSSTSPLAADTYRVDVTAITTNGLQGGSATTTITVS